jgi:hypothetical protein
MKEIRPGDPWRHGYKYFEASSIQYIYTLDGFAERIINVEVGMENTSDDGDDNGGFVEEEEVEEEEVEEEEVEEEEVEEEEVEEEEVEDGQDGGRNFGTLLACCNVLEENFGREGLLW